MTWRARTGLEEGIAQLISALTDGANHVIVDDMPPVAVDTSTIATEVTLASIGGKITACNTGAIAGAVSVTNFPATQPVSAASLPLPSGASTETTLAAIKAKTDNLDVALSTRAVTGLTDTQLRATAVPVSVASLPLPSGAATSAKQDTGNTSVASIDGKITACNTGAVTVSSITLPTLTKGTQGATGVSTQDLKDSGRTRVSIVFQSTATATADTILSLVKSSNGTAAGGATTIAVASGKTLRITSMTFSVRAGAAAAAFATFNVRVNPSGAAVIGSQSELRVDLGNTAATIGAADKVTIPFPDGFELSGTQQLAVTAAAQATTNGLSVTLSGFEY